MNCTNCGTKIEEADVNFCPNCGANLSEQQVVSQTPVTATPAQAVIVTDPAQVLPKRDTQRTVIIACLILIALVVLAVTGIFLWKVLGSKELNIDADTIKDDALRNTLTVEYDKDGDGKLSEDELDQVQTLELDAGDSYDFLNLFINLDNVTVKNTEVSELDLSQNKNLKSANFKDATNLKTLKLPDMSNYNNVVLPDNAQFELELPDNSEYEVKYVPKKVEETTTTVWGNSSENSTITYTQDVKSATRINSLITQTQGSSAQNFTYTYDNSGRITAWGTSKDIEYNEGNQVKSEAAGYFSPNYITGNATYADNGDVSSLSSPSSNSNSGAQIVNENGVISYAASSKVWAYWRLDSDKLTESVIYDGGASGSYKKWNYSWDGNRASSLVLTDLLSDSAYYMEATDAGLKVEGSDTISFEYDGDNMVKASYDSGFTQNFTYDSHGNMIAMTSTGTPSAKMMTFTTNCTVEYAQVIGKKNSQALNFLVLPGMDKKGLFNHSLSVRGITISGVDSYSSYTAFTQDFSGKFWWDEENIINAQVEAASQGDSGSSKEETESEKIERLTKQLNDEGYDMVVTGELRRHVDASSYGTNIIYFVRTSSTYAVAGYSNGGNAPTPTTHETDTFRISYGKEGSSEDAQYAGMAGHQVVLGFRGTDRKAWQSDAGCSFTGHSSSECDLVSTKTPIIFVDDAKLIDLES